MAALTIVRTDLGRHPFEQIVGADVSEGRAQALVDAGRAAWGPDVELPPAVYLLRDLDARGLRHPAGSMLTVGREISEAEALLLIRGGHSGSESDFPSTDRRAATRPAVSLPGGGVG